MRPHTRLTHPLARRMAAHQLAALRRMQHAYQRAGLGNAYAQWLAHGYHPIVGAYWAAQAYAYVHLVCRYQVAGHPGYAYLH